MDDTFLTGRVGWYNAPDSYIVGPSPSQTLFILQKKLMAVAKRSNKVTTHLKTGRCVTVYYRLTKCWERALVREPREINGELEHWIYLVDRGCYLMESDVRLVPEDLFHELSFTAVHVRLAGIKPACKSAQGALEESHTWSRAAKNWCRNNLVRKTVEVHISKRDADGAVYGTMIVLERSHTWAVRERLCLNQWALCPPEHLFDELVSKDGNDSDSSCDSFKSACNHVSDFDESDSKPKKGSGKMESREASTSVCINSPSSIDFACEISFEPLNLSGRSVTHEKLPVNCDTSVKDVIKELKDGPDRVGKNATRQMDGSISITGSNSPGRSDAPTRKPVSLLKMLENLKRKNRESLDAQNDVSTVRNTSSGSNSPGTSDAPTRKPVSLLKMLENLKRKNRESLDAQNDVSTVRNTSSGSNSPGTSDAPTRKPVSLLKMLENLKRKNRESLDAQNDVSTVRNTSSGSNSPGTSDAPTRKPVSLLKMLENLKRKNRESLDAQNDVSTVRNTSSISNDLPSGETAVLSPESYMMNTQLATIVTRSNIANVSRYDLLKDVPFIDEIHCVLRQYKYQGLRPVQSYSFPSIMAGHSTVMVSDKSTGKTMGYLVPLMNELAIIAKKDPHPIRHGPHAIIVCASFVTCQNIKMVCQAYANFGCLPGKKHTRIITVHGGGAEKERHVALSTGCELLIGTAHCLDRLLRNPFITNLDHLKWIAFDDFDMLSSENFKKPVNRIIKRCEKARKLLDIQYIVAAEKLTPALRKRMKTIGSYTLLLASHIEAAIYARLKPKALFTFKENKIASAVDEILAEVGRQRIIISCSNDTEVEELEQALRNKNVTPLIIYSVTQHTDIPPIIKKWHSMDYPVMIVSDSALDWDRVRVHNATFLLHFSIPVKSKVKFGQRFSVLMDNYPNHFVDEKKGAEVKVVIFVDDETHLQMRFIVDFLQRLGCIVRKEILDLREEIERRIEEKKIKEPICQSLLSSGECSSTRRCKSRHFLSKLDAVEPLSGEVTFTIEVVDDVTCWGVRVSSFINNGGERKEVTSLCNDISEKLQTHFAATENLRTFGQNFEIGDLCAVKDKYGVFFRVCILSIIGRDMHNQPNEVLIQTIDHGDLLEFKVCELLHLATELTDLDRYPRQAVLLHISGIVPFDFDKSWSDAAFDKAKAARARSLGDEEEWRARIRLTLPNVLVVEKPVVVRRLKYAKSFITEFDFTRELINNELALKNPNHLSKLAQALGISLAPLPSKEKFKPQWAHFHEKSSDVIFSNADSLQTIFLRQKHFDDLLKRLEDDCQKFGDWEVQKKKRPLLEVGSMCLARDAEDNRWTRALVLEIQDEWANVLFVDYGDTTNVLLTNLTSIPENLVTKLPCQAIECRLGGLEDVPDCPSNILDRLYDHVQNGFEKCVVEAVPAGMPAQVTEGKLYTINLWDSQGRSIGRLLAEEFELVRIEAESSFLDDLEFVNGNEDEDVEEEDEENDCDALGNGAEWNAYAQRDEENAQPEFEMSAELLKDLEAKSDEELFYLFDPCREIADRAIMPDEDVADEPEPNHTLDVSPVTEEKDKSNQEEDNLPLCNELELEGADRAESETLPMNLEAKSDEELFYLFDPCREMADRAIMPDEDVAEEPEPNHTLDASPATEEKDKGNQEEDNSSLCNELELEGADRAESETLPMDYEDCQDYNDRPLVLIGKPGTLAPKVFWQQNHDTLELSVQILRVDEKRLGVYTETHTICVECHNEEGKHYHFCWKLFGAIYPNSLKMVVTPFEIRLTYFKIVPRYWLRLKKDKERDRRIVYHPNPHLGPTETGAAVARLAGLGMEYIAIEESNSDDGE